jgi:sodium-dependent phosphate cotransporter
MLIVFIVLLKQSPFERSERVGNSRSSDTYQLLKNILFFLFFLYLFFVSIELIGKAFKGFGGGFAEQLIRTTSNPFVGLFIGILSTSIVQSSSMTTSILVGMVAVGTIKVSNAIPVVMGANIGTTVTNTMVAMAHITRKQEFGRAFGGALLHDFFNVLSVLVLLPLHLASRFILPQGKGFLQLLAEVLANGFGDIGGTKFASPLKKITGPTVKLLREYLFPAILRPFFGRRAGDAELVLAILTLVCALVLLFLALKYMTRFMRSALLVKIENLFDAYLFKTAIRGFAVGAILTAVVQSSSVTTSLAVPLIGAGILTMQQIFPYVLGANLGTTITAMLASLALGNKLAITVAFAHLWFNIWGTIIWYPLKKVPIAMSRKMAEVCTKSRKLALIYIAVMFYIVPGLLILLAR